MACANHSSIFVNDLPSYGLIGLISLGLVLYLAYLIAFIRNRSSTSVYISFSQFALFGVLICPILFLIRPGISSNWICSSQTLAIQILPFCFLLGYNIHLISQWLVKFTKSLRQTTLIFISSFLIFFLMILIQTGILLIWFYHNHSSEDEPCEDQCHRSYFLCSLIFHFILLFLYSLQSSIKYHYHGQKKYAVYLLTSLLAFAVDIIWIGFYLLRPARLQIEQNYILAYGLIFFAYAFLGPFLYEELFYRREGSMQMNHVDRTTFKCLSLTKEQQRAFMAAYIKRNLTASCENLTSKTNLSLSNQINPTRHSTLSVDSLCPTVVSTISYGTSLGNPTGTLTSEYLLVSTSTETK